MNTLSKSLLFLAVIVPVLACSSGSSDDSPGGSGAGTSSGGTEGTMGTGGDSAGAVDEGPRVARDLAGAGWAFQMGDPADALGQDLSTWTSVSVPHSFNALDGQDGQAGCTCGDQTCDGDYYRGPAWYGRTFALDAADRGERIFLKFGGASIVASVYVNGTEVGSHAGAFGAFNIDVTEAVVEGKNDLRVRVDNTWREDIPPLSGDFTMFGGLYRGVALMGTRAVHISPLDFGSSGVYLGQSDVSPTSANVSARVIVKNDDQTDREVEVRVSLRDADGELVASATNPGSFGSGQVRTVDLDLTVTNPRLWNGPSDPYLYQAVVETWVDEELTDRVIETLGLRSFHFDGNTGFSLNGNPHNIRGVNRHQDHPDLGWALSLAEHEEDMAIIREIGANGVRLAHYPHAPEFYELADRAGLFVWAEIPLVNEVRNTLAFSESAKLQLVEMIRQNYNHPSIFTWGLYNEIGLRETDDPEALIGELQVLAKAEDPTRVTTAATFGGSASAAIHTIPDVMAANMYPGWYYGAGTAAGMRADIDYWKGEVGGRPLAVSEYGAGASVGLGTETYFRPGANCAHDHTEEYQALLHEGTYEAIAASPDVWGSFVWNMFDFASDGRDEGDAPGRNDKGLVSYDRKTRKYAFYFYKANWNPDPMVYISGRRLAERSISPVDVRVYSNCPEVELFVGDVSVGVQMPSSTKVAVFQAVGLAPGDNQLRAVGHCESEQVEDVVDWHLLN